MKNKLCWIIGIHIPFNRDEVVKRVFLCNEDIATFGLYMRGRYRTATYTSEFERYVVS